MRGKGWCWQGCKGEAGRQSCPFLLASKHTPSGVPSYSRFFPTELLPSLLNPEEPCASKTVSYNTRFGKSQLRTKMSPKAKPGKPELRSKTLRCRGDEHPRVLLILCKPRHPAPPQPEPCPPTAPCSVALSHFIPCPLPSLRQRTRGAPRSSPPVPTALPETGAPTAAAAAHRQRWPAPGRPASQCCQERCCPCPPATCGVTSSGRCPKS